MHEEEKFYSLMALVCRRMPHYAVQMTLDAGYGNDQPRQFLHDVKRGRTINLAALVALVQHSLPAFEIPAHLLPEPAEQQAVTA
jgi:hypothetical protein